MISSFPNFHFPNSIMFFPIPIIFPNSHHDFPDSLPQALVWRLAASSACSPSTLAAILPSLPAQMVSPGPSRARTWLSCVASGTMSALAATEVLRVAGCLSVSRKRTAGATWWMVGVVLIVGRMLTTKITTLRDPRRRRGIPRLFLRPFHLLRLPQQPNHHPLPLKPPVPVCLSLMRTSACCSTQCCATSTHCRQPCNRNCSTRCRL